MGQLSFSRNRMFYEIKSRTSIIPSQGTANTPYIFKEPGNNNFNILNYRNLEKIYLWVDDTTNDTEYYTPTPTLTKYFGTKEDSITLNLRLNPFIYNTGFSNAGFCFCDQDADNIFDDKLVSWSI